MFCITFSNVECAYFEEKGRETELSPTGVKGVMDTEVDKLKALFQIISNYT